MTLLTADPGFANFGYGVLSLEGEIIEVGVIRTEKSPKKRRVLEVDDMLRRTQQITRELHRIVGHHKVRLIACEAMSYAPNASSAAKLAMGFASLAAVAVLGDIPIIQATPQMVRKAILGRSGDKDELAEHVAHHFKITKFTIPGVPHEHILDALAVGIYALSSDLAKALRRAA